jgi:hypothetical protein
MIFTIFVHVTIFINFVLCASRVALLFTVWFNSQCALRVAHRDSWYSRYSWYTWSACYSRYWRLLCVLRI